MTIVWQTPASPPARNDYIFRNGMRYVRPYYFEFVSHVKNRWIGKNIIDLFTEEFVSREHDYYVSAVKSGRIQVNGEIVPLSHKFLPSDRITHFLHRHEPPVLDIRIPILQEEPEVLTIYKPPSIPVHPSGQYRKNTVVGILQAEYGLAPLFPIHRLDRLVSGLLILARSPSKAEYFRQQIVAGRVQKKYIAKVIGVFPDDEQVVEANVNFDIREGRSTAEVLFNAYLSCINWARLASGNHLTLMDSADSSSTKGKTACTKFTRISTNGTHSLVLCEPISGRSHQIRVHLQYSGHPIANDPLYLSEDIPSRTSKVLGTKGATDDSAESLPSMSYEDCQAGTELISKEGFSIDPMCPNCPSLAPNGYEGRGRDVGLWLHCIQYSGPDWAYECPYPDWASTS